MTAKPRTWTYSYLRVGCAVGNGTTTGTITHVSKCDLPGTEDQWVAVVTDSAGVDHFCAVVEASHLLVADLDWAAYTSYQDMDQNA